MFKELATQFRMSVVFMVIFTVFCGLLYPGAITLLAQVVFPQQANGSLVTVNGKTVGSSLIGQPFDEPQYFWGRPSATSPFAYNAGNSSGSNLGPTNPAFLGSIKANVDAQRKANPDMAEKPVPMDLVTASGSGLDPHISPAGAEYQVARVSKARGLDPAKVRDLMAQNTQGRWLGFIGDPGVNVLKLNLALDALGGSK